ncbi:hypothetical protein H0H81_007121 [Sphagnurus paluster]|uniref:Uncharacterized protein n=1 Tax=Sphagnurus paluster TaxID=117069 RepID=A0A9P7K1W9_9AGAR|nr:hypothetical protein H0H81_007121 [Sphagnurus paluster]
MREARRVFLAMNREDLTAEFAVEALEGMLSAQKRVELVVAVERAEVAGPDPGPVVQRTSVDGADDALARRFERTELG